MVAMISIAPFAKNILEVKKKRIYMRKLKRITAKFGGGSTYNRTATYGGKCNHVVFPAKRPTK